MRRTFAILAVALVSGAAEAQPSAGDSAAVLSAARRAEQRFESVRRANLPWHDRHVGQPCDARIGMYCYWYDPTDRLPEPREPEQVRSARRALIATLDSLAGRSPSDGTILGQRVLYRLEAGDTAEAAAILEARCSSGRWWCLALLAHLHHLTGDDGRAGATFDSALTRMDSLRRCRWTDISPVLPPDARKAMRPLSCDARRGMAERIWWLADPLLGTAANELRTEYLTRRTLAELGPHGSATYDLRWNDDAAEMLLRYGAPVWWSRERPSPLASAGPARVTGHEPVPSFAFLPRERVLTDDTVIPRPSDWDLDEALPTMRYAPARATSWRGIDAQIARFRRGDTLLVIGSYDTGGDTLLEGGAATLALSTGPGDAPYLSAGGAGHRAVLVARAPIASLDAIALAGIEVVDTVRTAVGRFRTGIAPLRDAPLILSDLLLHEAGGATDAAASLDAIAPRMLPTTTLTSPQVGMYWEAYCLAPGRDPLTVTLVVERTDRPLLARINARLGFDDPNRTVRIDWQDVPRPDARCAARSMRIDLRELPDGDYDLRLDVRRGDATASTTRSVRLRR